MPAIGQSRHLLSVQYPITGAGVSNPPTAGRARNKILLPSLGAPTSPDFHKLFIVLPPPDRNRRTASVVASSEDAEPSQAHQRDQPNRGKTEIQDDGGFRNVSQERLKGGHHHQRCKAALVPCDVSTVRSPADMRGVTHQAYSLFSRRPDHRSSRFKTSVV
jgi:hypothetical protein